MRLADGQHVHTTAHCIAEVQVGSLYLQQRFEVLTEGVATILGMPFLECTNPMINWKRKQMRIKYKGKLVEVPTHNRSALTIQQDAKCVVPTSNSFGVLPIPGDQSPSAHTDVLDIVDAHSLNDDCVRVDC